MSEAALVCALDIAGINGLSWGQLRAACQEVDSKAFADALLTLQASKRVDTWEYEEEHLFFLVGVELRGHCKSCICDMSGADGGDDLQLARAKRRVLRMLNTHGPMTVSMLRQKGFNATTRPWVAPAVQRLADERRLREGPGGYWELVVQ